jgi:hypothetical protein
MAHQSVRVNLGHILIKHYTGKTFCFRGKTLKVRSVEFNVFYRVFQMKYVTEAMGFEHYELVKHLAEEVKKYFNIEIRTWKME